MRFKPSKYSHARRNWSRRFPEDSFLVGSQRGQGGIPSSKQDNASRLSDFLAWLPFPVTINSAYRSPSVNAEVGGSSGSQHMNALAVDIKPPLWMKNYQLASWFWVNQMFFPHLDQVIWYSDGRKHLHVGICPPGATGCASGAPRKEFLQYTATGKYVPWFPSPLDMPRAVFGLGPVGLLTWGIVGAGALGAAYYYQDDIRSAVGL
jgi:hypothetical protein